jgi:hypothetical protein
MLFTLTNPLTHSVTVEANQKTWPPSCELNGLQSNQIVTNDSIGMNKTLTYGVSSSIDVCQNDIAIRQIRSKDFDNTPEAKALSQNLASLEAILDELGITKPAIQKYCRIVIAAANGTTGTFQCSDLTIGARYFYGDRWLPELSRMEKERCSKQGARLHMQLRKICPGLVLRQAERGDKPTELQVPLINLVLRVSELMKLGYSPSEAVGLLDIKCPDSKVAVQSKRSPYANLKHGMTLIDRAIKEDPDLVDRVNAIPPVLIHGFQKGQPLYRKVGIRQYELQLKDDESKKIVKRVQNGDFDSLIREAESRGLSLVFSHTAANIIQLDDCDPNVVIRIQPYCFEVVETSPHNYHCRLALPIGTGQTQADSVKNRLLKTLKPVGSVNAGGGKSFRLPGSTNFKPDHGNKVTRIHSQEKFTSIWELSIAGLIPYEHKAARAAQPTTGEKKLPDYDRVKTYDDHSNSAKDFNWARQAASWGLNRKEIVNGLKEKSPTADKKGDKYIEGTVDRAIKNSSRWRSTSNAANEDALWIGWSGARF